MTVLLLAPTSEAGAIVALTGLISRPPVPAGVATPVQQPVVGAIVALTGHVSRPPRRDGVAR